MAEPLKARFGPDIAEKVAAMISPVYPEFAQDTFVREALVGFEALGLTARAKQVAQALGHALPDDPGRAMTIVASAAKAAPEPASEAAGAMAPFVFAPLAYCIAQYGLPAFEESMAAQYEVTQRFTAEFSIRPFIAAEPDRTLARLTQWTLDPSEHVRRLVSEGTRPRLPWAPRLPQFQRDPEPVVVLLERLRHDTSGYVRRSVANNLNDISKDHPEVTIGVAERWWPTSDKDGRRMLNHALRTLVKKNDAAALAVLGYVANPNLTAQLRVTPDNAVIGDHIQFTALVTNDGADTALTLADIAVEFVKANGSTSTKVFRGSQLTIPAGQTANFTKSISLQQHATRKHYPGQHTFHLQVNGVAAASGTFELRS
jgi:3-methyladenine DNA glycosylase AlkC